MQNASKQSKQQEQKNYFELLAEVALDHAVMSLIDETKGSVEQIASRLGIAEDDVRLRIKRNTKR